jgi:hypothetical protein
MVEYLLALYLCHADDCRWVRLRHFLSIRAMPISKWVGDYDPVAFDALPIKYALGRIAKRRNAAKARISNKSTS